MSGAPTTFWMVGVSAAPLPAVVLLAVEDHVVELWQNVPAGGRGDNGGQDAAGRWWARSCSGRHLGDGGHYGAVAGGPPDRAARSAVADVLSG